MATEDIDNIPTIIEPDLTSNQMFENSRINDLISDIYPFSVLTIGNIYKVIQIDYINKDYYFNEEDKCMNVCSGKAGIYHFSEKEEKYIDVYSGKKAGILTITHINKEDDFKIRVWAPIRLIYDINKFQKCFYTFYIRPTGLHNNINTKYQYYTYELSV